jgi:predicted dehydrogenase
MMDTSKKVRWGIIGPGGIAHKFAEDIQKVPNAELLAVASRSKAKADAFAKQYNAERAYESYQLLADDPQVDAVYIATPHAFHKDLTLLCLNRKKAVLCEKPFAMNSIQVKEMIQTAKTSDTLLMEAMWTLFLPHYQMVLRLIKEGAIGNITGLEADFGFKAQYDPESRLVKKELGGGSLLDIGIYPVFLALSVLGMPDDIEANVTIFDTGADSSCNMLFSYGNNVKAHLQSSFLEQTPNAATIFGEQGKLTIHPNFHAPTSFSIEKDGKIQRHDFDVQSNGYSYEIEHFSNLLLSGKTESPLMAFKTSKQLIQLLDQVRNKIGLEY